LRERGSQDGVLRKVGLPFSLKQGKRKLDLDHLPARSNSPLGLTGSRILSTEKYAFYPLRGGKLVEPGKGALPLREKLL